MFVRFLKFHDGLHVFKIKYNLDVMLGHAWCTMYNRMGVVLLSRQCPSLDYTAPTDFLKKKVGRPCFHTPTPLPGGRVAQGGQHEFQDSRY